VVELASRPSTDPVSSDMKNAPVGFARISSTSIQAERDASARFSIWSCPNRKARPYSTSVQGGLNYFQLADRATDANE